MSNEEVIGKLELTVEWNIANVLCLSSEVDKRYHSHDFYFAGASWCLRIYPNGQKKFNSEGYIGLYLVRRDSGLPKPMTYQIFLRLADGRKEAIGKECSDVFEGSRGWGKMKALSRSRLIERKAELLSSDALVVVCVLKNCAADAGDGTGSEENKLFANVQASTQTEAEYYIDELRQDLKELSLSGKNSDLILKLKGKEFLVHRCILAARSPVFSAMMEHEMREKSSGVVVIEDSDLDTFPDFLHHLYTGRAEHLTWVKSLHLYQTADKYQVNELKNICLRHLLNNISVENFCDVISLSLQYQERELTDAASQFFLQNSMAIVSTPKWQVFLSENLVSGNELLIKLIQKLNN